MKYFKDTLLFLHGFDESNMFDLEHNIELYFVSEVLSSQMYRRIIK